MKIILYGVTAVILSLSQNLAALEFSGLLDGIAKSPHKQVDFTETRMAYFLDEPLISKGSMEFKAPSTLIKRFHLPSKIEQRIEGDILLIRYDGSENIVSLESNKELATAINAIRWFLSGNFPSLKKSFVIDYKFDNNKWTINFIPKDLEVVNVISEIILNGEGFRLSRIIVNQSNGDVIKTDLYDHQ